MSHAPFSKLITLSQEKFPRKLKNWVVFFLTQVGHETRSYWKLRSKVKSVSSIHSSLGRIRLILDSLRKPSSHPVPVLSPRADTANTASPSSVFAHPAVSSCAALMEPLSPVLPSYNSFFTRSATALQFTLHEDLISEFLLSRLEREDLDPICRILALISFLFKINFKLTNNSLSKLLKIKRK